MKDKFFRKGLVISTICILMLPTIAIATTNSNSNYNLKVKIKNTRLLYNSSTNLCFSVNVSNEGPDSSDNYSVRIETRTLISFGKLMRTWFTWTGMQRTYTGSPIAPNDYEKTLVYCANSGPGCYLVRAIVNSKDTNITDNVSYCLLHVYHHWIPLFGP